MNTVLKVENLCKKYKTFEISNVNFAIKEGSIVGFIGINGAGKTTTIKSILGLVKSDSGKVLLFEKERSANEREIFNRIGIVLDGGYFYENLTLKEMKSIYAPAYNGWDEKCFQELINKFNLPLNQKIDSLSKGMKMKFSLVLAMSHHAELLIMDEPTSGLDPKVRSDLMKILQNYVKDGKNSVLLSTHITSDLDKIADSLILINKGKIIFSDETNQLIQSHMKLNGRHSLITKNELDKFVSYNMNGDNITGILRKRDYSKEIFQGFEITDLSIEDLMLAYIEEGYND